MLEFIASALSAVKQSTPPILIGIALTATTLLFMPVSAIETLGLSDLVKANRSYIGIALIASIAFLVAHVLVGIGSLVKAQISKRKVKRALIKTTLLRQQLLQKLTPDEKAHLLPYIEDEINTRHFAIDDGVAGGLQAKGVIYRATNIADMRTGFPFNIQPWAREHLVANPELLTLVHS
jgi:Super-infection exclusion protein B